MRKRLYYLAALLLVFTNPVNSQKPAIRTATSLPDIYWASKVISVCWENPETKNQTERNWVAGAITESWQKWSQMVFKDWCDCRALPKNAKQVIRILISDDKDGSRVIALGSRLDNKPNGMILNFTFKKWGTALIPEYLPNRKIAIETISVHEFGHALGFAHQQNRNDCFFCIKESESAATEADNEVEKSSSDNGLWYTPCDPYSVMNYCGAHYFNFGNLSDYDKETVQLLYGKPSNVAQSTDIKLVYSSRLSEKKPNKIPMQQQSQLAARPGDYVVIHKKKWHIVNLYLDASTSEIEKIKEVEYILDPTFNNRYVSITNKQQKFRYTFFAWGNFIVLAKVKYSDGRTIEKQIALDKIPPLTITRKKRTLKGFFYEELTIRTKRG
jgi:hypothetical protein